MSLQFYGGWAQDPNAAPAVSGGTQGSFYQVAHRIKTKSGHTAISPFNATGFRFPMTVTCPAYLGVFESYQVLISNDGGANWRLAYTGAQTTVQLANFNSNWVVSNPFRTIAPGLSVVDLGTFSSTISPSVVVYGYAETAIQTLQIGAVRGEGQAVPELYGKLIVEFVGKYTGVVGNGAADLSGANSATYDHPYLSRNLLDNRLSAGEIGIWRLSLVGFDASNPINTIDQIKFVLQPGLSSYPLPLGQRQASKAIVYESWPFYTSSGLTVTFKGLKIAKYGAVFASPSLTITLPASATTTVYSKSDGSLSLQPTPFPVGQFTTSTTGVTGFSPMLGMLPEDTRIGTAGAAVSFGQLVNANFVPGNYIGVALHSAADAQRLEISAKGPTWVLRGSSSFAIGQDVFAGAGGNAASSGQLRIGYALSGNVGNFVLVDLSPVTAGASLSVSGTDLSIANRNASTLDVVSSTGNDVVLPAATTTEAGLMVAADKVAVDLIGNLGTFSGNTIPDGATLRQALQSLETLAESPPAVSGLPTNSNATLNVPSIADNAIHQSTVSLARSFKLRSVTLPFNCWIRMYQTSAQRTADASRSINTDPTGNHGVIFEAVGSSRIQCQGAVIGQNDDEPTTSVIYVSVQNLSGSANSGTVNFQFVPMEA